MDERIGILPAASILGSERFVIWDCYSDADSTYNRKLHFHDFFELSLVYEGESDFLVNGEAVTLSAGTVHMVTPSDYHMQVTKPGQFFRYYNFIFASAVLGDELVAALEDRSGPICLHLSPAKSKEIFGLAERLLNEYQSLENSKPPLFSEQLIERGLEALCILILRAMPRQTQQAEDQLLPIRRALSIIRQNYRQKLSLQEVAEQIYLSPAYFSQLFHKTMGVPFSEYLTDYRLQIAARYLQAGNLPLKEIAALSGFPTFPYFSVAFKKRFGVAPSVYRKVGQNETVS
ncbi:MAG: helix-turn-helix transcriptional regulator [Clostridia bacterium]|nr:helix-turn-helix transcriptional regulator [Clostridia bacterium]